MSQPRIITLAELPGALGDALAAYAQRPEIAALRDPARAKARCHEVTQALVLYLGELDVQADWLWSYADELGFRERVPTPWLQDDSHVVAVVRHGGRVLTVDFTAAQYGRPDPFPLIRDVTGTELPPHAPFLLTAEQAAEQMAELRAHLQAGGSLF